MSARYEMLSSNDISTSNLIYDNARNQLSALLASEGCFLTVFPECMVGSFVVLDKPNVLKKKTVLAFQLDAEKIVFIDDTDLTKEALAATHHTLAKKEVSPARLLFMTFRYFTKDDPLLLTKIEAELEELEESIVNGGSADGHKMLLIRRRIFALSSFYEQLADAADTLGEDEIGVIEEQDQNLFRISSQQIDRLSTRTKSLREYNFQLHELYQMQTDTQLNKTMRLLTVIATFFMPLTLLTGWYGMNFQEMPELDWKYGYLVCIGIALVIVVIELAYFRRKKWL